MTSILKWVGWTAYGKSTSKMHAVRRDTNGDQTLCGRMVSAKETTRRESHGKTRPRCQCCDKRAQAVHIHA